MNGIPGNLMGPLKETLQLCNVFDSDSDLRNLFIRDQRLHLWRNELRDADSLPKRVENLISALVGLHRSSDGENALLIFLQVLAKRYEDEDDRHEQLHALANTLKSCLALSPPLATNHTTTLQANPQAVQMLATDNLEKMLECTRSVAHIKLQLYRNKTTAGTTPYTGTGWLIAPGIVATCWHMITGQMPGQEPPVEDEDLQLQIQNMFFIFDYLSVGRGIAYKIAELLFPLHDDLNSITDYAILRLEDRAKSPLSDYRPLPLELDAPLTSQSLLCIIQHPRGDPQCIAHGTFEQESSRPGRIHYHTPTEKGTSGAPILNALNWHVIGLHNGEDQEAKLREGTLIKSILEDLHDKRPEIWKEIMEYHNMQISTNPILQTQKYAQTQAPVVSSIQEKTSSSVVDTSPADSSDLNGNSADKSSVADQPDPQPKENIKPQPSLIPQRYQDEFSVRLKTLRSAQKLFAIPILAHRNRRRVYPDECEGLLKELDTLEKLMQRYDMFFEQRESLPRSQRQVLLGKIHRFQGQIGELHSILTNFCAGNQAASSELQNNIHRRIKDIVKSGNKIKRDFTDILYRLDEPPLEKITQSTEGQVS